MLTRTTALVAFVAYALALGLWMSSSRRGCRLLWTIGCAVFLLHVACAFHFVHRWSHADALAVTAKQTAAVTGIDWGGGLYFNYFFSVLWLGDAAWWWLAQKNYELRSSLLAWSIHVFMAFMMFNATVVFGHGAARWTGAGAWALLALRWLWSRKSRSISLKART